MVEVKGSEGLTRWAGVRDDVYLEYEAAFYACTIVLGSPDDKHTLSQGSPVSSVLCMHCSFRTAPDSYIRSPTEIMTNKMLCQAAHLSSPRRLSQSIESDSPLCKQLNTLPYQSMKLDRPRLPGQIEHLPSPAILTSE